MRCYFCRNKITRYYEKDGRLYCKKCFAINYGNICSSCGKSVLSYTEFGGLKYCRKCFNSKKCISCSNLVGDDGVHIGHGMHSCVKCYKTATLTRKDLVDTYNTVTDIVKRLLTEKNTLDSKDFHLVDLKELRSVRKWSSRNIKGFYLNKDGVRSIYLLKGLSQEALIGTIAHELTHYYQDINKVKIDVGTMLYEGFAEWVSYKVLMELDLKEHIKYMESNSYKIYSKGLKYFVKLEENEGIEAVLKYLK